MPFPSKIIERAVEESGFDIDTVISGTSYGVDVLGEEWARRNKIPVKKYPADWKLYGKAAGPIRNAVMAKSADALIAVWDGESRGTRNVIQEARIERIPVHILKFEKPKLWPEE
jgi:hypothetical protein